MLWLLGESFANAGDHDACEGEIVETFEAGVEPFVVAGEPAEAGGPGEAAFDHPSTWQRTKPRFAMGCLTT